MTNSADVRRNLVEALQIDLIGPSVEDPLYQDEIISQAPSIWYLSGFLVPHEARYSQRLDEALTDETMEQIGQKANAEDETLPQEASSARKALFPSSIGLSFLLPKRAESIEVIINWGDYIPLKNQEDEQANLWQRVPRKARLSIPIVQKNYQKIDIPDTEGLQLVISINPVKDNPRLPVATKSLSVFLVNSRKIALEHQRDLAYIFQASLIVKAPEDFVARPNLTGNLSKDEDECIADLQYQYDYEFAVGHNISAVAIEKAGKCSEIRTAWIPGADVEKVEPSSIEGLELSMEKLAQAHNSKKIQDMLGPLVPAYELWLQEQNAKSYSSDRLKIVQDLLEKANKVKDRIASGIKSLENPLILEAFQITNRVIARSIKQRFPDSNNEPKWRPFQIAFVLMNIVGLAEPTDSERNIVDLLFFPTGGGKTEAYLGLAAFTMALRRLKDPTINSSGVTVLMRYTLRLLTLDQLSRAAIMVCALELERKENPAKLGIWPFEIGLWVGNAATPNRLGQKGQEDETSARSRILSYKSGKTEQMPIPLENCPWCGSRFNSNSFQLIPNSDYPTRLELTCVNRRCQFRSGNPLPILTIDETIYRRLPAFLLATVDKFASLPWVGESSTLFGAAVIDHDQYGFYGSTNAEIGERATEINIRPPELIIQDELHLISGPLGTMMGLYETAIDHLCSYEIGSLKISPKIVASTATVRRASAQIQSLFGRDRVEIFPPPGPDRHDSFFARTVPINECNGRLYLGIAAQGRSLKVILLRTYLALMSCAQKSWLEAGGDKNPNNPADPYMTLVGYFNSLRELGGSRRIVEDEVKSRLEKYLSRKRENESQGIFFNRTIADEPLELTSRVSTAAVAQAKALLAQNFQSQKKLDIVLATNMISVGLDITRLGLMVVYGQPKTVSEYIQATSRVGRDDQRPGLVVTLFNVHRPRDRSHYERFQLWHKTFYRSVEANSVTPFSPRALDRGLAGVIVTLARLGCKELTPALKASEIGQYRHMLNFIFEAICDRAKLQNQNNLKERINDCLDSWQIIAADKGLLQYHKEEGNAPPLLYDPLDIELENQPPIASKFKAQRSLRNVEPTVNLWVNNPIGVEKEL